MQITTLPYLASQAEFIETAQATQDTASELVIHTVEELPEELHGPLAEAYVRRYFEDTPILAEIARCESSFRHEDPRTGKVLRGVVNTNDLGMMQINAIYHGDTARRLGYDLETLEGNLSYAAYLYEREGTQPWSASRTCWQNSHLAMR